MTGVYVAVVALVLLVLVRRLLPADHRQRGRFPIAFLIIAAACLAVEQVEAVGPISTLDFLGALFLALGLVGMGDVLLFDVLLERAKIHSPRILRDLLEVTAFLVVLLSLLGSRGVDLIPLVTTSAVLTAVVGLALQSTIANLFAGISMQLDRSFVIGDWVQIGTRVGRIQQIKWRSTSILTRDNDVLVVPNAQLTTNEVLNLSGPTRPHRASVKIGFAYRHPPNEVKTALVEAVRGTPGVLESPPPSCVPCDFADSAVTYLVHYWMEDHARDTAIEGEVRTRIWYAAKRAGLEIPYPIRTILRDGDLERDGPATDGASWLERIDIFSPLDEGDRHTLSARMKEQHFAGGERIIRQGEAGDSLYLVKSGEVAVMIEDDGAPRIVATLGPGDFFGEMSLLTGEPRFATCAARTDVRVYTIDHHAFRALLESKPRLVDDISNVLTQRLDALKANAEAQGDPTQPVDLRVVARIRKFFNLR